MLEVTLVGFTHFMPDAAAKALGYVTHAEYSGLDDLELEIEDSYQQDTYLELENEWGILFTQLPAGIDELHEMAGRNCYQAWARKNPKTQTNQGYLDNILEQKHYSVLEHGSATFAITGVSTALLGQLSRHRHLSFSVLSKRYVDESLSYSVIHPGLHREGHEDVIDAIMRHHEDSAALYSTIVDDLVKDDKTRKQAREIARGVLPQATETRMVITGNMRAWREVIQKRDYAGADEEIQQLARELLKALKVLAPNTFQDMGENDESAA